MFISKIHWVKILNRNEMLALGIWEEINFQREKKRMILTQLSFYPNFQFVFKFLLFACHCQFSTVKIFF